MQQRERTPLHVVRIVRGQAEDAETYGNGVDEAQSRLWQGIRQALLIELVLLSGALTAALIVAWWPAP